jgi:SulP family sulfate permease
MEYQSHLSFSSFQDEVQSRKTKHHRYSVDLSADRRRASLFGESTALHDAEDLSPLSPSENYPRVNNHDWLRDALHQIPAVLLIGLFHLMVGIPFGVSYFPIGWASDDSSSGDNTTSFPVEGKEALGIRMFLFSTMIGQIVFTYASGFASPIGLQMIENVPFCHELATIVIRHQGYGAEALSTLLLLFGLASLAVGFVFGALGYFRLGRIVYYFPTHVLVGCIGGIGVYVAKTAVEVALNAPFAYETIRRNYHLLKVVLYFEVSLRILQKLTWDHVAKKPRYALLSPIFFCCITPVFYAALFLLQVPIQDARDNGYFFPALNGDCSDCSIINEHLWDMWRVLDITTFSWPAVWESLPTLLALILFSLIHVPINIPAFAISTNTEVDMNKELLAHGYANLLAGLSGGLQNYMAYTQSVLYHKSGGVGRMSGYAVTALTAVLFVVGPTMASYTPRCMAGALLLHVGLDLFLEGVYDSYGKFDMLEYAGIWFITLVMTVKGMEAAMIAGFLAAISTYVMQNMAYVNPIRGSMTAATLRSSRLNRDNKSRSILRDPKTGRQRILVIQLQGHLFFGNVAQLSETVQRLLTVNIEDEHNRVLIVILDFSLVLSIDSSAAQSIVKLKSAIQAKCDVQLAIFVSGSEDGFQCEYNLTEELMDAGKRSHQVDGYVDEKTGLIRSSLNERPTFKRSHVSSSLDKALIYAEDALVHAVDPSLLFNNIHMSHPPVRQDSSLDEEKDVALRYLQNLCPSGDPRTVQILFSKFKRETYVKGQYLWKQDSPGNCAKLLVWGELIAYIENEANTFEIVETGNTVGELCLVDDVPRMSSVSCLSENAVLYSLSRDDFTFLVETHPHAARLVDLLCIRYLSARVQLASNRIFETRCLPV